MYPMMKRLIIISSIFLCFCCKSKITPINQDYIKNNWIIPDSALAYIEDTVIITMNQYCDRIYTYTYFISNDTLFLKPFANNFKDYKYKIIFKILDLTSNKLELEFVGEPKNVFHFKAGRKLCFINDTASVQNRKVIKTLEFSSRSCFGNCPAFDLKITDDSIVLYRGYNYFPRYHEFSQHKLSKKEFDRINQKFNLIILDSIITEPTYPDTYSYSIHIITTDNAEYMINEKVLDHKFSQFIFYLSNIDKLFDYTKADSFSIRDSFNRYSYKSKINYAP